MKATRFSTSDFPLTFEEQRWAAETYEAFPVLRWPSGGICEPATLYFGWCLEFRPDFAPSSLTPGAYVVREWLTYLANEGIRYDKVNDLVFRGFKEAHKPAIKANKIHAHQVERKLATVYMLYRALDELLAFSESGRPRRLLVAPDERDRSYPVTTRSYYTKGGSTRYAWSGSKTVASKGTKRPTPGIQSVESILAWIRSKPERLEGAGIVPTSMDYLRADRNWLMARTMSSIGLRGFEVQELTVGNIWQVLHDENIQVPDNPFDLTECSPEKQTRILKDLENLNANTEHTSMLIAGKGRKNRYAPLPVLLVVDLLKIWVWAWRRDLLGKSVSRQCNELFLSTTDSKSLTKKAISKIIADAFEQTHTAGSAHRLRAHYCTVTAIRLWEDEMSRNGFNFSQAVYNVVLDKLADAMGHSSASTTVRYYLDLAVAKNLGFSSRAKYIVFSTIWKTIGDVFTSLSTNDIRGIVKVIKAFATPDTEQLKQVIALALANSQLNPHTLDVGPLSEPVEVPRLRLAFDKDTLAPS